MKETTFSPGHLVQMLCGGPFMVVTDAMYKYEEGCEVVRTIWMDGKGRRQVENFPAYTLKRLLR